MAIHFINDARFAKQGLLADGIILSVQERTTRHGTHRILKYKFTDSNGVTQVNTEEAADGEGDHVKAGAAHPVEYLPGVPHKNRLRLDRSSVFYWMLGGFSVLWSFLALSSIVIGRESGRRRSHVTFHGLPHAGRVLTSETRGSGKGRRHVIIAEYAGTDGQQHTTPEVSVSVEMLARWPVGSTITVLVDVAQPRWPAEPDIYRVRK